VVIVLSMMRRSARCTLFSFTTLFRSDERKEIGGRRQWRLGEKEARRRWVQDSIDWTRAAADALRPGGHLVVVIGDGLTPQGPIRSEEHTSELQSHENLVCRLLLDKIK